MVDIQAKVALKVQLNILNEDQFLSLFGFFGQAGIDDFKSLTQNKDNIEREKLAEKLAEYIDKSQDDLKNKLTNLVGDYYSQYSAELEKLDTLASELEQKYEQRKQYKKALRSTIGTFNQAVEDLTPSENKSLLVKAKAKYETDLLFQKREKARRKGMRAYLRGVAYAVIDNKHEEYIQEATVKANKIVEVATNVIEAGKRRDDKFDAKSEEGTKDIMYACFPKKKKEQKPLAQNSVAKTSAEVLNNKGFADKKIKINR